MHLWMFDKGIIHAECVGGDIDLLVNRRVQVGCFPWRFVDGEASIARIVAMVDDDEYEELMAKKADHAQNEIRRLLRSGACGTARRSGQRVLGLYILNYVILNDRRE